MEPVVLMEFFGAHHDDPSVPCRTLDVMRPVAAVLVASRPPEVEVRGENLAR